MTIELSTSGNKGGKARSSITVHRYVSMDTTGEWRQYDDFESKHVTIKTKDETFDLILFRDLKEE